MFSSVYFMFIFSFAYACEITIYGDGKQSSCKTDFDKLKTTMESKFRKTGKAIQENKVLFQQKFGLLNNITEKMPQGKLTELEKKMDSYFQKAEKALQESSTLLWKMSEQLKDFIAKVPKEQPLYEVAHGKMAKQSTTKDSQFDASKAIDGNVLTFSYTNAETKPYWLVDLGQEYTVGSIEVYNRQDCCGNCFHDVDITIGSTLKDMKLCVNYKGPAKTKEHIMSNCKVPLIGRFVKLTISRELEGIMTVMTIAELKVLAYKTH